LGIPEEARLVGTVGALTPQKGLEHLVRAAATVRREPLEAHFVIAGEGSLRGGLERLAKALGCAQTVHFLGHRPDIPELLAALDLFVLPSLWEGLPYALLEAGAAGVPIVATRVPGNLDLIRDGETGRLANPADALDLAVQIVEALGDENRAAMALRLQRIVEQEYTLERMTAGHAAVYQELVEDA
jgi:glycosyltransferase involved in cell wall biosynthesis